MPEIINDSTHAFPKGRRGFRRALLLNPPVYDAQYWARWSQPAGLLRIASYLQARGYGADLVDCMETNARGFVPKTYRRDADGTPLVAERGDLQRQIWHFGLTWEETRKRMAALPERPDEIWITSIMTYWWESTRDAVRAARAMFPDATIYVGGIYPTLAPEHAQARLTDADYVFTGEIREASDCWTDLHLYQTPPTYAILTTSRGCPWDCNY